MCVESKFSETLAKHSTHESMLKTKIKIIAFIFDAYCDIFCSFFADARLQQVLGERDTNEQRKHDLLVSHVTQTLERTCSAKLERCVKEEIRTHVLPCELRTRHHNTLSRWFTSQVLSSFSIQAWLAWSTRSKTVSTRKLPPS